MHHKVILEALRQVRHLKYLQDEDADHLHQLTINAHHEAEDLICKDRENGYRFLTQTFNEAQIELEYARPKIQHELENLRGQGLDEYDSHFSNVKHIALELEDFMGGLADLLIYYYPKEALENQVTVKEYASIPAKQHLTRYREKSTDLFHKLFLEFYEGGKRLQPEVYNPTDIPGLADKYKATEDGIKKALKRLRENFELYHKYRDNIRGNESDTAQQRQTDKQKLIRFQKDLQKIVKITNNQNKLEDINQLKLEIGKIIEDL
jgi:hypothetical protein